MPDFIKAVKGEPFTAGTGLYGLTGKEINQKKLFREADFDLQDEKEYVILQQATITVAESLDFLNTELADYNIGFPFYKSMLPGITLKNTITGGWQLFNSFINGSISISENSQTGNINISNSSCVSLSVSDNYASLNLFNAAISLMKFSNCCIPDLSWQTGTRAELYISGNCKIPAGWCLQNFVNSLYLLS